MRNLNPVTNEKPWPRVPIFRYRKVIPENNVKFPLEIKSNTLINNAVPFEKQVKVTRIYDE